jgi:hypothetical protein
MTHYTRLRAKNTAPFAVTECREIQPEGIKGVGKQPSRAFSAESFVMRHTTYVMRESSSGSVFLFVLFGSSW